MGRDHLLEGGEATRQAIALALEYLGLPGQRIAALAPRRCSNEGCVPVGHEGGRERLSLGLPDGSRIARRMDASALTLHLFRLARQLHEAGGGPLGVARDRFPGVLQRGDPAQERHLGLPRPVQVGLGGGLAGQSLLDRLVGGARLGLGGHELAPEPSFLLPARVQVLDEGPQACFELSGLLARLRGTARRVGDLLLAVAALALEAIDREGQLVETSAGLLQLPFLLVETRTPRLHLGLFRLESQERRPLALPLGRRALREGSRDLLDLEEAEAIEHPLEALHLLTHGPIAPRLAGLALQTLELLLHLVDDVVDAKEVLLGCLELEGGLAAARLVLGDPGGLFDERPPIGRLRREDLADLPLLDDGVGLRAEARVHEQLVDVAQSAHLPVHQVLALAVPVEAPCDDALRVPVRAVAVQPAHAEVDLGHPQGLPRLAPVEDHVLHGDAPEALDALLSEDPGDGVGDVALATAVRADDPGHAALEIQFLLVAEGLEANDLDSIETHENP